jgi:hypothetical protein
LFTFSIALIDVPFERRDERFELGVRWRGVGKKSNAEAFLFWVGEN